MGLQDDVVLVELRVHRVDFALAIGVVESVVQGRGGNSEARRGDPVNRKKKRLGAGLLIGGDVFQAFEPLQLGHEFVGPFIQLVFVGILEGVLILGASDAVVDADVLHRLHVQGVMP